MKTITPIELRGLLAAQPEPILLDVRTPVEFGQYHVPQARNEPLDSLQVQAPTEWGGSPNGKPVYLLCGTGKRATLAAQRLAEAGWNSVVVEGGTEGWIGAGFPVTHERAPTISLERQVRIAAGAIVLTGVILGWTAHPAFYGLAGFVGAGLVFAGVTDFCGMALLLAKLPWNARRA